MDRDIVDTTMVIYGGHEQASMYKAFFSMFSIYSFLIRSISHFSRFLFNFASPTNHAMRLIFSCFPIGTFILRRVTTTENKKTHENGETKGKKKQKNWKKIKLNHGSLKGGTLGALVSPRCRKTGSFAFLYVRTTFVRSNSPSFPLVGMLYKKVIVEHGEHHLTLGLPVRDATNGNYYLITSQLYDDPARSRVYPLLG